MPHSDGKVSPNVISIDGVPFSGGQPKAPAPTGATGGLTPEQIRRQIIQQQSGGLQFGSDLQGALEGFNLPPLPGGQPSPTTGPTAPTGTTVPGGGIVTGEDIAAQRAGVEEDPFATAEQRIGEIFEGKEGDVSQIVEAIQGLGDLRTSAFDRLFGEESRISRFFAPAIQAVEEQILDTEELLTSLRGDIQESFEDVGLTQPQFRRIEAKERGVLVDQMDKLARSHARLRSGLDIQLQLSDREFQNTILGAQDNINALTFQLEQSGIADQEQINLIKRALESDLQEAATIAAENRQIASEIRQEQAQIRGEDRAAQEQRKKQVQEILLSAQDFVLKAGVVPTGNFQQVIADVLRMADEGATLSEMQLGVLMAIGDNPQVREFINSAFQSAKSGGGGGGGGGGGTSGGGGGGGGTTTNTASTPAPTPQDTGDLDAGTAAALIFGGGGGVADPAISGFLENE